MVTEIGLILAALAMPTASIVIEGDGSSSRLVGTPMRLFCNMTGNPPPAVRWMKDGKELSAENSADGINIEVHAESDRLWPDTAMGLRCMCEMCICREPS